MSYAINSVEIEDQMFEIWKKVVAQDVTEQKLLRKNYFAKIISQKMRWKLTEVNDSVSNLHGFLDSNYI